ncbi:MAG: class I SAM-dependent methyltransferase [Alsobacter sp.]
MPYEGKAAAVAARVSGMASSWRDFFDGDHAIYVNDRHRLLHDRIVTRDIAALVRELAPGTPAVLDFGCGAASEAVVLAAVCGRLVLSDAAPAVLARVRARFDGHKVITVAAPDDVRALPAGSLDVVVVNSLLQYLSRTELQDWLDTFRLLLRPGGRLVLGDVVPPDIGPLTDAAALLRFGFEGGFLVAACVGLVRTALSDYRKLRRDLGLSAYAEADILAMMEAAGFAATRHRPNIGHNQARMTLIGTREPE